MGSTESVKYFEISPKIFVFYARIRIRGREKTQISYIIKAISTSKPKISREVPLDIAIFLEIFNDILVARFIAICMGKKYSKEKNIVIRGLSL